MFTGIVQGTAKIVSIEKKSNLHKHTTELPDSILSGIEIGASISYNGCCLTVTKINGNHVTFDLIQETLRITNLGKFISGNMVNIERAARFDSEIGGHIMSGHILTTAEIMKIISRNDNCQICLKLQDPSLMKYLFYKGYIGVDGISLTVGDIKEEYFYVYLIPETIKRTTLSTKKLGEHVNIEVDSQTQTTVDTVERIIKINKLNKVIYTLGNK